MIAPLKKITARPIKYSEPYTTSKGTIRRLYVPWVEGERLALCSCGQRSFSQDDLPFFKADPEMKVDSYYCGCSGWD